MSIVFEVKETIKDYEMALDETEQPIDLAELDEMEDVSEYDGE